MIRRISLVIASVFVFTSFCFAEVLDSWQYDAAYKPNPILFLHGFAKGNSSDWDDALSSLRGYFSKYSRQQTYLEVINFNDPNGSVDTYGDGRDGWADKLEDKMNDLLDSSRYGSYADKANLVCHSMAGLAARWYLTNYSSDYVDKLILIGVPNLGSNWAVIANAASKIPKVGWASILSTNAYNSILKNDLAVTIEMLGEIDIYGEAVDDMDPTDLFGSGFLRRLNNRGQSTQVDYYGIIGTVGNPMNWIISGTYFGGDCIVSEKSQLGADKVSYKEQVSIHANHWREIETASNPFDNKILQFLDSAKPVFQITSPDPNTTTEIEETSIHIKGEVYKEYLPADSTLTIGVIREEGGYTLPAQTSFLKPSDLWIPNNPDSPVAEFDERVDLPGEGIYIIKVTVINPAGVSSEEKIVRVRVTTPSGWIVGPYYPKFEMSVAGWLPDEQFLSIHLLQNLPAVFPWATITLEDTASLRVGVPAFTAGVGIDITEDFSTAFIGDYDYPCKIVFSRLELRNFGRISGTISGQVRADLDDDGKWELHPLYGTFENVIVTVIEYKYGKRFPAKVSK